jgi:DNA invertase Pin-like site-specific DNA recombinase
MRKCAIYARVALPGQQVSGQVLPLRKLAAERGFEVVAEYQDQGISGTKARRSGLDALMLDARRHRFSVVLVAAFDRIAKSTRHFLQVLDEFGKLGIEFISTKEAVDTTGAMGGSLMTLFGLIAQLDGALVRERIRQGMARRRLEGFRLGRAPLSVDHQSLVRDRLSGMSLTNVAKKYGISRASVVRFSKQANGNEAIPVGEFRPAPVQAPVECFA